MTIGEMAAADLRWMISEAPVTFTFDGADYVGTVSGKNLRRPLAMGGFQEEPEITLAINLFDANGNPTFIEAPSVGMDLVIGLHTYRVERTEVDEFSQALQLDLRSPSR
jgi:hypothetical protein